MQNAHPLRRAMSRVAGLDPERVRVVAPDVAGGFGVKGVLYPEDLLVGLLAMRTGRPVKWVEDRAEHMRSAIHAREQVHEIQLGLTRDGEVVALRDHILVDCGAFNPLGLGAPVVERGREPVGNTPFPGGPGLTGWPLSNFPTIIASIRTRLLTLPATTVVHPGHGPDTTIAAEQPCLRAWISRGW